MVDDSESARFLLSLICRQNPYERKILIQELNTGILKGICLAASFSCSWFAQVYSVSAGISSSFITACSDIYDVF
jgi:F0F1-type ATP synthase assembly protein I